jgi:hypothetical protein
MDLACRIPMPNNPLFYPVHEQLRTTSLRDQIQMALAIANPTLLKSLLINCIPQIAPPQLIGNISVEVSVPAKDQQAADGILHFEGIKCLLTKPQPEVECYATNGWSHESQEYAKLTQCESELYTLGQNLSFAAAVSLLISSGFCPQQVEAILHLPCNAWHKSWWYALNSNNQFTIPFLRLIRTRRYPDGTFTIQYKNYFEQDKPSCFRSIPQKVKVKIKPDDQGFGEVLGQINLARNALDISQVILICHTISELEAQAFISQGISIYPAAELVLPTLSNCSICARRECSMNGLENSPVAMCYGFLPE